jgi:serine/threonine protein kinase
LEAADRNVENLWTNEEWWSNRKVTDLHLARWVSRQCYGLTDALWRFHEFPKNEDDSNAKTRGLHCDIKPDNLLHYQTWDPEAVRDRKGTVDDQLGVIQLSDFGLSSFHSTHSVENLHVPGDFLNYAAPETEFLLLHSPATDVWHLGCLFMDFATWLLEGPEGYQRFCESRLTTGLRGRRCRFATFTTGAEDGKSSGGSAPRTIVEVNETVLKV